MGIERPFAAPLPPGRRVREAVGTRGRRAPVSGRGRLGVVAVLAVGILAAGPAALAQTEPTTPTSTATTSVPTTVATTATTVASTTTTAGPITVPTLPPIPGEDEPPGTDTTLPGTPPSTLSKEQAGQLTELQGEYEDATTEEIEFLKRYLAAQSQAEALGLQVLQLDDQLAKVDKELAVAQEKVRSADRHLRDTEARLADAEDQLLDEEDHLAQQAVDAYIGGGTSMAPTDAVLRGEDVNDVGKTLVYTDAVVTDTRSTIDKVGSLRDEVEGLRDAAEVARRQAVAARDEVASREATLRSQRDDQSRLQLAVEASAKEQQALLVESAQRRADYAARIAELTRVSDGISETLAKRQVGQVLPLNLLGIFLAPVENPKISSTFGPRVDPFLGTARMHNGMDMSAPEGTPIRASADGTVVIAAEQGGYGLCTVIDHGSGLGTLYGHQSVLAVKPGDVVKRGQVIGFVGSTGRSTGPHLHWEVRQFGQPVDPVTYLAPA